MPSGQQRTPSGLLSRYPPSGNISLTTGSSTSPNSEQSDPYELYSMLRSLGYQIYSLIAQKNSELSYGIAKSSAQIAEESRRDSYSMKTIAVLTLIFLPGTAIAVQSIHVRITVEEFSLTDSVVLLQHDDIQLAGWAQGAHCIKPLMGLLRCLLCR